MKTIEILKTKTIPEEVEIEEVEVETCMIKICRQSICQPLYYS